MPNIQSINSGLQAQFALLCGLSQCEEGEMHEELRATIAAGFAGLLGEITPSP